MALKRFFSNRFIIGTLFLLNPVICLFDVLPDFVGFLLLYSALSEAAYLDERLENARRMTLYGAGISAIRTVLMLFSFDMDESWVLSIVSLLGIAELFFAIYFCISFFGGISYMAQRFESENVLNNADKIKNTWIIFWVVHTASTILPELTAIPLLTIQHDPYAMPGMSSRLLLLYKNGIIMVLAVVNIVFGIWLINKTAAFSSSIKKDKKFVSSLSERYEKFLKANPLQEIFLKTRLACILLCVGFALQINYTADGVAVLPAWVGSIVLAVCLIQLGVKEKHWYFVMCASAAVQLMCALFKTEGGAGHISVCLLGLTCIIAVLASQQLFREKVKETLGWETKTAFNLSNIPFVVAVICRAVYCIYPVYWFNLANILCFGLWLIIVLRLCSGLMDEIKLRRRL